jgi:hypothetical protein
MTLKERIKTLEADLKASPMRHYVYYDLPFAIFCGSPVFCRVTERKLAEIANSLYDLGAFHFS